MKQRLVKGFLVLALLCLLPGMMLCKGRPVQANPEDSEDEEEEEEAEKTADTDTEELERKQSVHSEKQHRYRRNDNRWCR